MNKKLLAAILALGMALSLAGCGNRQRRRGNYEHDHRMGHQTLYC